MAAVTLLVGSMAATAPVGAEGPGEDPGGSGADGVSARAARGPTIATYPIPTADAGLDSIVVGPDRNLWVSESRGWKLARITTRGAITERAVPEPSGSSGPTALVRGADGYLWFLTDSRVRVRRTTPTGAIESVASNATGRIFDELVAGAGRGVWLTETGGAGGGNIYRLRGVNPSTGALEGWSLATSYLNPSPMALARDGALWYGDAAGYLKRVDEAGRQSNYPIRWPNPNVDTSSLAVDRNGGLWATGHSPGTPISSSEGGMVGRYAGGRLRSWVLPRIVPGGDPLPHSLTLGPDGALWWAERNGIGRITTSGQVSRARIAPWSPRDITFGPDGRLWFVDRGANRVGAITIDAHLFPPRSFSRSARLTKVSARRVKGRVASAHPACRAGQVVAYTRKAGRVRAIGSGRANAQGVFSVAVRKHGRSKVYVVVKASAPSSGVRCLTARSRPR